MNELSKYRTNKGKLEAILASWTSFIRSTIRVVACGGTALTLLELKDSTKDVDFIVPEEREYQKLMSVLQSIGYQRMTGYGWAHPRDQLVFDLYRGNKIFTTELLQSPLSEGNSLKWKTFGKLEVRILNPYDLIISKVFRGTTVDLEDSVSLVKLFPKKIDITELFDRYRATARYEIQEEKVMKNFGYLIETFKENEIETSLLEKRFATWRRK